MANNQNVSCDLCVVGGGSGGLAVAAGAAQMGAKVVLIERDKMGGDCLNTGCVPSKSLIASAAAAHAGRAGAKFGVHFPAPIVKFGEVHDHIHGVIGAIAPHDSVERFESLGVQVIKAEALFEGPKLVRAGDYRISARRFVIATGSCASIPSIDGILSAHPLTNETVFDLKELPDHLIVLGGGPIGLELAQAYSRLGAQVTVLVRTKILPKDEPEATAVIRGALKHEGVDILEGITFKKIDRSGKRIEVSITHDSQSRVITGTHLLVATGRTANVRGLGLDAAGIAYSEKGVTVDSQLRSTNRRVFAIGDVVGGPQFTHIAGYHAGLVIRNALLGLPAKTNYSALPWVTYTDPEVAHIGMSEAEARQSGLYGSVLAETFAHNDRAQAERATQGMIKVILGRRGRILGATIVGPHAGELIGMWGLAISQKLKISAVAGMIAPYPTLSELSKRTAGNYFVSVRSSPPCHQHRT